MTDTFSSKLAERSSQITKFTHPHDVERAKERFAAMPFHHQIWQYWGDWGFNVGSFDVYVDTYEHEGKLLNWLSLYLVHSCHEASAFQKTPEYIEYLSIEELSFGEVENLCEKLLSFVKESKTRL